MLTPRVFSLFLVVSCLHVAMRPLVHAKAQARGADPTPVAQWLEEMSPEAWEQRLERSPEWAATSLLAMGNVLSGSDAALSERGRRLPRGGSTVAEQPARPARRAFRGPRTASAPHADVHPA